MSLDINQTGVILPDYLLREKEQEATKYEFYPEPNISALELAGVLAGALQALGFYIDNKQLNSMEPLMSRHFKPVREIAHDLEKEDESEE